MRILIIFILLTLGTGCVPLPFMPTLQDKLRHHIDLNVGKVFDVDYMIDISQGMSSSYYFHRLPSPSQLRLWSFSNMYDRGIHVLKETPSETHYELVWLKNCRYVLVVNRDTKIIDSWYFSHFNKTYCAANLS